MDLKQLIGTLEQHPPEHWARLLGELHERGGTPLDALLERTARTEPAQAPEPALYQEAREHFAGHEERLRRQARVTDDLIGQLRENQTASATPAAVPQQELPLQGVPGATVRGRFVVDNALGKPAQVSFRPSELRRVDPAEAWWAPVRFTPARAQLAPGDSQVVTIALKLEDVSAVAGQELELDVDVSIADRPALKLWVTVRLVAAP